MILMVINNILINTNETLKTPKNRPKLTYTVNLTYILAVKFLFSFLWTQIEKRFPNIYWTMDSSKG